MTNDNFSELIYFLYGLSFYTMGICAWLQGNQKASAFTFVRSFKYLSYFGIVHGTVEWLLMVLYMGFFPEYRALFWQFIVGLNIMSFLFLWYFGIELYNSGTVKKRIDKRLPFMALLVWAIIMVVVVVYKSLDWPMTIRHENLISRYLIGFPASITASIALFNASKHYIFRRVKSVNVQMLTMSGAFFIYAVFAGLIDLNLDFFPAKFLNRDLWLEATGVQVEIIRAGLAMIITAMFLQIIPLFKRENEIRLAHLKENHLMSTERKRLSRALHDGVLQDLFVAGIELNGLKEDYQLKDEVASVVTSASVRINEAMVRIREFISEVAAGDFEISDLIIRIRQISDRLSQNFEISIKVVDTIADVSYGFLSQEAINNLFYMIQEGVMNALKHSGTKQIDICFATTVDWIRIEVVDYGCGFDITSEMPNEKLGLKSLYERAEATKSSINVKSSAKGTRITITTPWEVENESE